jgi:hypothetical protein
VKTINNSKLNLISICLPVLLLIACSNDTKSNKQEEVKKDSSIVVKKEPTEEKPIYVVDTFYNTITQLIGGMDSTLTNIPKKWDIKFIKNFSQNSNAKYEKIKKERLEHILSWNNKVMSANNQADSGFAFYPFSGGDFIHLNWLYPNAKEYYMIAKEPVGDFPDLMNSDSVSVNNYLKNIDVVLRDIYFRSYFITKNMNNDINGRNLVNGMFPLIMWAASKTGHEIIEVKFGCVNDSGVMEFKDKKFFNRIKPDAVEVTLRKINTNTTKKLTYLSCDISDPGFTAKPKYFKYLQNRIPDTCISFIKSASYLLHYNIFVKMRNFIKSKTDYLAQDDTGIPFKEFKPNEWKVELYGVYTRPVEDFKTTSLFQRDLDSAYKVDKTYKGALNFSLGYHWSSKQQNQMVFKKRRK